MSQETTQGTAVNKWALLCTTALIGAFAVYPAYAQDADEDETVIEEEDEVMVVRGIRGSLREARDIKRDADTFVDSVTASDVSTLPDLSVAEALSRIPGVTRSNFRLGGSEGDFPSPEGAGNLVRGLGFVRSEFNGRDAFTANGGRALDWASIPPELIGGVDVYKNQSADLIEGGIGGTINLRTLEPFDREGTVAVFIADGTYTDIRDTWSPGYSAVLGDRWDTEFGEFGLLASYSFSELKSDINGYQASPIVPRLDLGSDGVALGATPGFQLRTNEVDRDRESYYVAAQWRSPDDSIQATFKYARVENEIEAVERTTEWFPDANTANSDRIQISDLKVSGFNSNGIALCNGNNEFFPGYCDQTQPVSGLMESGLVSDIGNSWYGAYGLEVSNLGIGRMEESTTQDYSANIKWRPADRWYIQLDAHYTDAESSFQQLWIGSNTYANVYTKRDLDDPELRFFIDPRLNINQLSDPSVPYTLPTGTGDPLGSFIPFAADEFRDGTGDLYAVRGDVEYEFEDMGWFESVTFGARYSEREQTNQEAGLNWAGVSQPWNGGIGRWGAFDKKGYEVVDFSEFFRGGVVNGPNTDFVYADPKLLLNYDRWLKFLGNEPDLAGNLWSPLRPDGRVDYSGRGTVSDITEETLNLYAKFDFYKEFSNGMSLDGNFGVRYVKTDVSSVGNLGFAEFAPDPQTPSTPENPRTPDAESRDDVRDFLPELSAFLDQPNIDQNVESSDEFWLPSFNAKWNLNDEMLFRFGVSKALTRPNVADIRAAQTFVANVSRLPFPPVDPTDPLFGVDRGAQDITLRNVSLFGGNPNLEPTTAISYDISYEWYFGGEGYLTVSLFRKDLENIFSYGQEVRGNVTFDGQTANLLFNGVINQDEAEVQGIELAYQQFYDFLPGFWGNFGFQGNYTYIDATATPPLGFVDNDGDGAPDPGTFENTFRFGVDGLLGQSKHIINAIGIYQDERFEARLAYNWRSEYLSSYRDFVTGNPIYQQPVGFLDASLRYDIDDNWQLRFLAANLLDTKQQAEHQVDQKGQRDIRSSFITDRRFEIGVKYEY